MFPRRVELVPARMPPVTNVPPLYVFAPESVTMPAPDFVKLPVPLITPANVPAAVWSNVTEALFRMLPWRLVVVPISAPDETVVPPEYVLAPVSVQLPEPTFVTDPVPPIAPWNTASVPSVPTVRGAAPSVTALDGPPLSDPSDCPKLFRSRMAPVWTSMKPVPKTSTAPARSTPNPTVVPPVYVLAPDSVSVPAPAFTRGPAPDI